MGRGFINFVKVGLSDADLVLLSFLCLNEEPSVLLKIIKTIA